MTYDCDYEWPTVTKDTSVEEIQAIHKRIWDYVIEHGHKPKTPYAAGCAACEYASIKIQGSEFVHICSCCPIKWDYGMICSTNGSLYHCYTTSKLSGNLKLMRTYAKEIRDVDFKRS